MLDAATLLGVCDDDERTFAKLRTLLLARLPDELQLLQEAFQRRDFRGLRTTAHSLTGMVVNASTCLGRLASALEDAAEHEQVEEARSLLRQLGALIPVAAQALELLSIESLRASARP